MLSILKVYALGAHKVSCSSLVKHMQTSVLSIISLLHHGPTSFPNQMDVVQSPITLVNTTFTRHPLQLQQFSLSLLYHIGFQMLSSILVTSLPHESPRPWDRSGEASGKDPLASGVYHLRTN